MLRYVQLTGMSVSSHQEIGRKVLPAVEAFGGHLHTSFGVLVCSMRINYTCQQCMCVFTFRNSSILHI